MKDLSRWQVRVGVIAWLFILVVIGALAAVEILAGDPNVGSLVLWLALSPVLAYACARQAPPDGPRPQPPAWFRAGPPQERASSASGEAAGPSPS
jgi:hypothetical protein